MWLYIAQMQRPVREPFAHRAVQFYLAIARFNWPVAGQIVVVGLMKDPSVLFYHGIGLRMRKAQSV